MDENFTHDFDCACGCTHSYNSRIFEGDINASLLKIMPAGIHILYCGNCEATKELLLKHYRVSHYNPKSGVLNKYDFKEKTSQPVLERTLEEGSFSADGESLQNEAPEDLKLIVGEGEGIRYAKYLSFKLGVKVALFSGGNLSEYAYITKNGFASLIRGQAADIVLRESLGGGENLAKGFGEVISAFLCLFDWDVSALLFNGNICPFIFKEAKKAVITLLSAAGQYGKNSKELKKALISAQLRLSVLSSYCNSGTLFVSGAHQMAAAQSMLFSHEKRPIKSFEENAFLFAPIAAKVYAAFLSQPVTFVPPPDNNLRLKRLNEYFGVGQEAAYALMPPYFDKKTGELADYRVSLYREELKNEINEAIKVLTSAFNIFLRLYPDDGFWFKGYLDGADVKLCIALGSDILPAQTLLSYMRHKGVLESYI